MSAICLARSAAGCDHRLGVWTTCARHAAKPANPHNPSIIARISLIALIISLLVRCADYIGLPRMAMPVRWRLGSERMHWSIPEYAKHLFVSGGKVIVETWWSCEHVL